MPIKFYNPTSAGRRAGSVIDYKATLTKFEPEKSLVVGRIRANGRNHHGVITAKHRGGGNTQQEIARRWSGKCRRHGFTLAHDAVFATRPPNRRSRLAYSAIAPSSAALSKSGQWIGTNTSSL